MLLYTESKTIINKIGIFNGKQKEHNIQVLTLLYENQPLSAWELTAKITNIGKQSLHATLNKRLRSLEEKGYVRRRESKWHLRSKGIIAILLIQSEPKKWSSKWTEIFEENSKNIAETAQSILKTDKAKIQNDLKSLGFCLDDFNTWIILANKTKELMEKGVINFDIIKEDSLLAILFMETKTQEQLSRLFR